MNYSITYSVGTSIHDERHYFLNGIPASQLASRIISLQSKGKKVISVEIDYTDAEGR